MFVICNVKREVVTFAGMRLFGKKVCMMGIFREEQDALDVLFEAQETGLLKDHTVENIGTLFIGEKSLNEQA